MKRFYSSKSFYIAVIIGLCSFAVMWFFLREEPPIKVGFLGALTGKYSDLGIQVRNGVQLAVEELNEKGGVNGKKLQFIFMDNQGNVRKNQDALKQLAKLNIKVVIGPLLSTMALTSISIAEKYGIILLSPTVSSSALSDKKDLFFRIIPDNKKRARTLAKYVLQKHHPKKICVIQDISNKVYTQDFLENFLIPFGLKLDKVSCIYNYRMVRRVPFRYMDKLRGMLDEKPDLVVIAASSVDTAFFSRVIWDIDPSVIICGSNWAKTDMFLLSLGSPVYTAYFEGIDPGVDTPKLASFKKRYFNRFGRIPSFASVQGYDAVRVLARAMSDAIRFSIPLDKALTKIRNFPGLFSPISINEYGDAVRPAFVSTIENGRFKVVRRVE